jgi:PAS domain S-box-containing protein
MREGPPTVLPLIVDWPHAGLPLRESLPVKKLADAAAELAHAHLELDRDGIARSVYLMEGLGKADRPQLALALLRTVPAMAFGELPGERDRGAPAGGNVWMRDFHIMIPFLGPAGHFKHVSYVDVLRGAVSDSQLRGKIVLVGATAQGLGDAYPTPRSGEGIAMPGVEISANVLNALRTNHAIRPVSRPVSIVLAWIPLCAALLGFLRLSPRNALALTVGLILATVAASLLALRFLYWWWPPAAALCALILAYPLWSWRRLEATQAYLDEELKRLDREPMPLAPAAPERQPEPKRFDVLQGRIDRVRDATARLRHLRTILSETVAATPDAMLLVDREGRIVLANQQAAEIFNAADAAALEGRPIWQHLDALIAERHSSFSLLAQAAPSSIEVRDSHGRELMLRVAAVRDAKGRRTGCVLDIADVSELKSAQRERDDMIRFLSHDLRSPSSSLLALAEIMRDPARAPAPADAARRIESLARRTLALADGFIALARAHVMEPARFDALDLRDALQDAVDEVWAAAESKRLTIRTRLPESTMTVRGDRQMLGRAFANLLNNAVKYSPPDSPVDVAVERCGPLWRLSVRDSGPGIPPDRQSELFQRFRRVIQAGGVDPGGVGLGLAFVRVVARKHGGDATVESSAGQGACFGVTIPADEPRGAD